MNAKELVAAVDELIRMNRELQEKLDQCHHDRKLKSRIQEKREILERELSEFRTIVAEATIDDPDFQKRKEEALKPVDD